MSRQISKSNKITRIAFALFFFFIATRLVSNVISLLVRLGSIILAVLTLWYGFALEKQQELDIQTGYFNVPVVRLAVLAGVLGLQV